MIRKQAFLLALLLALSSAVHAQQQPADLNKTIAVQRAIGAAREHLRKGQALPAIQVLEAELVNADGNGSYLKLLKDAYGARLKELRLAKADATKIADVERRMQLLDGPETPPAPKPEEPAPSALAKLKVPTAPPPPAIPTAPEEVYPPAPALGPTPIVAPPTKTEELTEPPTPNPFLENPPLPSPPKEEPIEPAAAKASAAFRAKDYAQAAALFATADKNKERLTPDQRDEWAYARLHQVATRLNRGDDAPATLTALAQEVDAALRVGSERLLPFGEKLLQTLKQRGGSTKVEPETPATGWQVVTGKSVRVLHMGKASVATEIAHVADSARVAMYERWAGPPASEWTPKCDIYLHPSGAEYAKATKKPADHPGHCTVSIKGGVVTARRLDVRADDATLMEATLPHEITQVVLTDLFAEQLLPRWALVGIAGLAESPENVARYRRAVPDLLKDKKLFTVGPFMEMANYPDPTSMTAFYAESVSLVSYLVEQRGPKAFVAFLREAPRRGYAKALTTHYGFRDANELQDRWLKAALTGERE